MRLRFVEIDEIKPGMVLAKELTDSFERVVTKTNMRIRNGLLEQMKVLGFAGAYLEDDISDGIYIGDPIPKSMRLQAVHSLKEFNVDNAIFMANKIVKYLRLNDRISMDSLDLRTYDEYVVRHSVNVCIYSVLLGAKLGLSMKILEDLAGAAMLHDVGNFYLDHRLVYSQRPFNSKEYEMIKEHVFLGVENLQINFAVNEKMLEAIAQHHENEDGSGYPEGLSSEDICDIAKILHIVDVYDALMTKKPYRKAYRSDEAMNYLIEQKGILFDADYVDAFAELIPFYYRGMKVKLSDGTEGCVDMNYEENFRRPRVRFSKYKTYRLNDDPACAHIFIVPPGPVETLTYLSPEESKAKERRRAEEKRLEEEARVDKTDWEHLLLVDDMVSIRKIFEEMVKEDYRLTSVNSGESALAYLEEHQDDLPDLVIMDIHMPGMDGFETTRVIREQISDDLPILFFSESAGEEIIQRCYECGGTDFVQKPFKSIFLMNKIEKLLVQSIREKEKNNK